MRDEKYYFRWFFLLCLALILSGCDKSKTADIIVGPPSPMVPITEGVSVDNDYVFLLTTLPNGFIVLNPPDPATPISYSLSITPLQNTCNVIKYNIDGTVSSNQALSGTTYSNRFNQFMGVQNCIGGTNVQVNMTYLIGIQKYIGTGSFTA
jgi:hypothetical protein